MVEKAIQKQEIAQGPIMRLLCSKLKEATPTLLPSLDRRTFGEDQIQDIFDPCRTLKAQFNDFSISQAVHYKGVLVLEYPELLMKQAFPFTTRYSRLLSFKETLQAQLAVRLDGFPEKRWWGNKSPEVIEGRMKCLSSWLSAVLARHRSAKTVVMFLEQIKSNSKSFIVPQLVMPK